MKHLCFNYWQINILTKIIFSWCIHNALFKLNWFQSEFIFFLIGEQKNLKFLMLKAMKKILMMHPLWGIFNWYVFIRNILMIQQFIFNFTVLFILINFMKKIQFRYATSWDVILMIIATVCSFVKTLGMPCSFIIFGEFTTLMVDRSLENGTTSKTFFLHIFGGGKVL